MILTEMHHGQGLGNQLFCYITARTIAADKGVDFGLKGLENLGDRRYNDKGLYFMDLYLGKPIDESKTFKFYKEKELRLKNYIQIYTKTKQNKTNTIKYQRIHNTCAKQAHIDIPMTRRLFKISLGF